MPGEAATTDNVREELFNTAYEARCNLQIVGATLVAEALDDADPGRNIGEHPDYIAAQERIRDADQAIRAFMQGE